MINARKFKPHNDFIDLASFPHRIIQYLIESKEIEAEQIWKILKYNEINCLDKPNLTVEEKKSLRWVNDTIQDDYRVFFKPLIGDGVSIAQTQLRIFRQRTIPKTQQISTAVFYIQIITNEMSSMMEFPYDVYDESGDITSSLIYVEKTDILENLILKLFNGKELNIGVGALVFDKERERSNESRMDISNSKTFYGRTLVMSLDYSNAKRVGGCGD